MAHHFTLLPDSPAGGFFFYLRDSLAMSKPQAWKHDDCGQSTQHNRSG
ncbi:Hypothetical protein CPI37_1692 [Corynebacterium pseudotuberculosis]|nr:Hypothetical protein CPI37_1692 [Corynebacterium pseudotuberculosis]